MSDSEQYVIFVLPASKKKLAGPVPIGNTSTFIDFPASMLDFFTAGEARSGIKKKKSWQTKTH